MQPWRRRSNARGDDWSFCFGPNPHIKGKNTFFFPYFGGTRDWNKKEKIQSFDYLKSIIKGGPGVD
jgi:hypothetical protein